MDACIKQCIDSHIGSVTTAKVVARYPFPAPWFGIDPRLAAGHLFQICGQVVVRASLFQICGQAVLLLQMQNHSDVKR